MTEALKHRLADMHAAQSPIDLEAGSPKIVQSSDHEIMTVDLRDGYRIEFSANHPNNPTIESGKIDWGKVTRIKILRIEGSNE